MGIISLPASTPPASSTAPAPEAPALFDAAAVPGRHLVRGWRWSIGGPRRSFRHRERLSQLLDGIFVLYSFRLDHGDLVDSHKATSVKGTVRSLLHFQDAPEHLRHGYSSGV
jgi:hypothetical protein